MIQALNQENAARFAQLCEGRRCLGPILTVNSALFGHCPQFARFYVADNAAMMLKGSDSTLCGETDEEELAGMLAFAGVRSLRTSGTVPMGWQVRETLLCMEYDGTTPPPPLPDGVVLDTEPPLGDVLPLLEKEGITGGAADNFYSEACTKRNHGAALIWTAHKDGTPVATAGAYALTSEEAYLATVATLPPYRGQGIGSALTAQLARYLAVDGRRVTLLCAQGLEHFYKALGFSAQDTVLLARR